LRAFYDKATFIVSRNEPNIGIHDLPQVYMAFDFNEPVGLKDYIFMTFNYYKDNTIAIRHEITCVEYRLPGAVGGMHLIYALIFENQEAHG
jgi:hypothetical protein